MNARNDLSARLARASKIRGKSISRGPVDASYGTTRTGRYPEPLPLSTVSTDADRDTQRTSNFQVDRNTATMPRKLFITKAYMRRRAESHFTSKWNREAPSQQTMLKRTHASIGPTVPSPCSTKEAIGRIESVLGGFVEPQAEQPNPSNTPPSHPLEVIVGQCGAWMIRNHWLMVQLIRISHLRIEDVSNFTVSRLLRILTCHDYWCLAVYWASERPHESMINLMPHYSIILASNHAGDLPAYQCAHRARISDCLWLQRSCDTE
ncbi:hypothetical protein HZ326_29778 [Fusarium oxysporum f. sp. albedinis]|nr:hypothetical protein HZ326_29778 [Fusarium oxysporum f. sp. albedinis]